VFDNENLKAVSASAKFTVSYCKSWTW